LTYIYTEATHVHLDVSARQINPIVNRAVVAAVVVGSATVLASNWLPQVNALAAVVELQTAMIRVCPSVGVPDGLLKSNAPACAVTINMSVVSQFREVPVSVV
jgi:hypothetical protein